MITIKVGDTIFSKDGIIKEDVGEQVRKLRTMNRLRKEVMDTFDAMYVFDDDFSFLEMVNELPKQVPITFEYEKEERNFCLQSNAFDKLYERKEKENSDITADTITGIAQNLGSHTSITAKDVAESMLQITAGILTKEQLLP
ncbi:hypothetical protein ACLBXI_14325 [Bacillus cereus]